jgi:hypothetical protein
MKRTYWFPRAMTLKHLKKAQGMNYGFFGWEEFVD